MKIEIEIKKEEFIDLVAKRYAEILYKKGEQGLFGARYDLGKIVKKKALELLEKEVTFVDDTIKTLLKDKEFIKEVTEKVVKERISGFLKKEE